MQKSTTCLPDVNVWLALATRRSVHHRAATEWANGFDSDLLFCRITQMGLLRLLTNHSVMGSEILSPARAWAVYDRIAADARVGYLHEPGDIEHQWRRICVRAGTAGATWTASYLLAVASQADLVVATFDRGLAERDPAHTVLL
jgi:toxin-antitoxin system PIN domain toxin